MRIALAQMDPTTGDFNGNVVMALALSDLARENGADLVVFPPYTLCGDAAGRMAKSASFSRQAREAVDMFANNVSAPTLIGSLTGPAGGPDDHARPQAFFCENGHITALDAQRDSVLASAFQCCGRTFAVCIDGMRTFPKDASPDVLIDMCALRYRGRDTLPGATACFRSAQNVAHFSGMGVIVSNLVGGEDECVYSGGSFCLDADGSFVTSAALFKSDLVFFDIADNGSMSRVEQVEETAEDATSEGTGDGKVADETAGSTSWTAGMTAADIAPHAAAYSTTRPAVPLPAEADYRAIQLALGDYMRKNSLTDAVIGLSGGMDSALVVTIAADALGPEHVHVVLMPSEYSSEGSVTDSELLAKNLGIEDVRTIPIGGPLEALRKALDPECDGAVKDIALENLQARIRTLYVMALSNTHGWTMLNTGNKSEAAMGFSTLYGDTAGAYSPLGDVYKTHIYDLAKWRNSQGRVIPKEIIEKVPSAELHPDQRDDDRLPPYDKLDPILAAHVEGGKGLDELIADGFDPDLVADILSRVKRWEFKRRQEPISAMVSACSFADRDWPITNSFVDKTSPVE